jgi:hypothetical protein
MELLQWLPTGGVSLFRSHGPSRRGRRQGSMEPVSLHGGTTRTLVLAPAHNVSSGGETERFQHAAMTRCQRGVLLGLSAGHRTDMMG